SGVLEYQPNPWLSLYAIPAVLDLSDNVNGRPVSSSGLGDLPLVVAASYAFPRPESPTVGAALVTVLPTGNAACGLGSGQTAAGLDLGVAISPRQAHLAVDASRSLSGVSAQALSRVIGAGVRHTLAHSLMVTIDGSHGLTAA